MRRNRSNVTRGGTLIPPLVLLSSGPFYWATCCEGMVVGLGAVGQGSGPWGGGGLRGSGAGRAGVCPASLGAQRPLGRVSGCPLGGWSPPTTLVRRSSRAAFYGRCSGSTYGRFIGPWRGRAGQCRRLAGERPGRRSRSQRKPSSSPSPRE